MQYYVCRCWFLWECSLAMWILNQSSSDSFWLWAFNNLLWLVLQKKYFSRGIIQHWWISNAVENVTVYSHSCFRSSVCIASTRPIYKEALSLRFNNIGLFYGYAYQRTHRLESAILVHFLVNLSHFLFFSYPMCCQAWLNNCIDDDHTSHDFSSRGRQKIAPSDTSNPKAPNSHWGHKRCWDQGPWMSW